MFPVYRVLYRFSLRGLGINHSESFALSGERHLVQTISENLSEPVCIDVGAHRGNYIRLIQEYLPQAHIYAFEPHPESFKRLQEQLKGDRTNVFPYALGKTESTLELYDFPSDEGTPMATLNPDIFSELYEAEREGFEVQSITLDNFLTEASLERVDFLKIDVEGGEFDVLKGAERTINQGKIDLIQFEFNRMNIVSATFLYDFEDFLSDYKLFRLLPDGFVVLDELTLTEREIFKYQNILAVREGSSWLGQIR